MSSPFSTVSGLKPGRSEQNLSYEKKFTANMGQLIPVMCDEVVPGDVIRLGNQIVLRFPPLVAPIMHEIYVYTHYFHVPYRLLCEYFEEFITGGVDGEFSTPLPTWKGRGQGHQFYLGSLADYIGHPVGVAINEECEPLDFPRTAYNFIWNEYYRDQNHMEEVPLDNEDILLRCWRPKDMFNTALPWQQRGVSPALPIGGSVRFLGDIEPLNWTGGRTADNLANFAGFLSFQNTYVGDESIKMGYDNLSPFEGKKDRLKNWLNNNEVDGFSVNIADIRTAFQVQKWMERNARAGVRYTEFLRAHFGVTPTDERLDRPEYIGGTRSPIIISEVLQTSESQNSPQGNMAGHGITVDRNNVGTYRVKEFGLIIGIMSVMPQSSYQQGIDRQWLRRTRYDFYFPEFAQLSEQAIFNAELFVNDNEPEKNMETFGYTGRYNEMRRKRNQVCGLMRTDLAHWHLGRIFLDPPALNEEFLLCNPESFKRVFAVQDEPQLIVTYGNIITAYRPMPAENNPGLIDHF